MKCPHCTEPGEQRVIFSNPGGARVTNCFTCGGTNEVSDEYGRRITVGLGLRGSRVGQSHSGREYAIALGVPPVTLAHVEQGFLASFDDFRLWNRLTGENLDPFSSPRGRCE